MPVEVQMDSWKQMRHVHNPIATTLDDFALVLEACHKPPCVPVHTVRRSVVEPVFSRGHKALKATELPRSSLVHPLPHLALPLSCAHLRITYRCACMTERLRHCQAQRRRPQADVHVFVRVRSLLFRLTKRPPCPCSLTIRFC
jgi:hypothetical protein